MNTQHIQTETQTILNTLLTQNPTEEDKSNLRSFQILHNAYLQQLQEGKLGIEWNKVEPLPEEF